MSGYRKLLPGQIVTFVPKSCDKGNKQATQVKIYEKGKWGKGYISHNSRCW